MTKVPFYGRIPQDEEDELGDYNPLIITKLLKNYRSHPCILEVRWLCYKGYVSILLLWKAKKRTINNLKPLDPPPSFLPIHTTNIPVSLIKISSPLRPFSLLPQPSLPYSSPTNCITPLLLRFIRHARSVYAAIIQAVLTIMQYRLWRN